MSLPLKEEVTRIGSGRQRGDQARSTGSKVLWAADELALVEVNTRGMVDDLAGREPQDGLSNCVFGTSILQGMVKLTRIAVLANSLSFEGHGDPFSYTSMGSRVPGEMVTFVVNCLWTCQRCSQTRVSGGFCWCSCAH